MFQAKLVVGCAEAKGSSSGKVAQNCEEFLWAGYGSGPGNEDVEVSVVTLGVPNIDHH